MREKEEAGKRMEELGKEIQALEELKERKMGEKLMTSE